MHREQKRTGHLWSVEEQIAEGNKVLTRFILSGTHRGEFLGIPATNRVVQVWGMVIDRFENGKVKSTRILLDALSMMQQLGAVRAPLGSGSKLKTALQRGGPQRRARVNGVLAQQASAKRNFEAEDLGRTRVGLIDAPCGAARGLAER